MKNDWPTRPLSEYVTSRPGNNKIIKGKQSDQPGDGLVQAFSASGPDVWVTTADYNQPGVVISAVGARCGKTFIAEGEWTAIANTHVLLPGKQIDPRWLWYRTNEETFWIRGGAAQPFVKVKDTLQQPCKIPPLAEQQRIVGLLDEAFEGLATAKANAEKNLQNARALFESHLQSVFTQRGPGWVETTIGELCDIKHGCAFDGADFSNDVPDGSPLVVTPGNFTEDGKLLFNERNTKRFSGSTPSGFQFDIGDLVVVMTDLSSKMKILGKPAFVETDDVLHNQRIGRLVFSTDRVEKRLLYYFMMTEGFLKNIQAVIDWDDG